MAALSPAVRSSFGNTISFEALYFEGADERGAASDIPFFNDITIGGRSYRAETSFEPYRRESYRSQSIAAVADKTDISNIPSEGSVGTQGLWRREAQDWSQGAGQLFHDRRASSDNRFRASKGINPWTQWTATLLNDVTRLVNSSTVTLVKTVANYLYKIDGGTVSWSTNGTSWTAVTGYTANSAVFLDTDGYNVYIACATHGIFLASVGATTAASWITGTINYVWYVGGQLLAATNNLLYAIFVPTGTAGPTALTAAGASGGTALLYTQNNAEFVWDTACAGNSWIYIGGSATSSGSGIGLVYRTQINSVGTALLAPVVSATLPGGELVYSLYAYTNYIMMGTSLGARFCETLGINDPGGNAGDLKLGPIIPDLIQQVTKPVRAFVGQFRFCYFGWSNYDDVSTGLGRMDLSTFIDVQAPAYTSDLMVTGDGEILSMDWWNGNPVFVVEGLGLYTANPDAFVPQGTIDMGYETFGIPDDKVALFFDVNAIGLGTVSASISVDDGDTVYQVGALDATETLSQVPLPQLRGDFFETTLQLNATTDTTGAPTLRRYMLKSLAAVVSGTVHLAIINLFETEKARDGSDEHFDPYEEFAILDAIRQAREIVDYAEGPDFTIPIVIISIDRLIYKLRDLPEGGFDQRFVVSMQTLEN